VQFIALQIASRSRFYYNPRAILKSVTAYARRPAVLEKDSMSVIPKSLQSLIHEAKAGWEVSDSIEGEQTDSVIEAAYEFVDDLSRGVYSQELYLNCVADDCEEVADWNGAKDACHQIIELRDFSHLDRWRAHARLGDLHALLEENDSAIEHYHTATAEAKNDDSEVLCRCSLSQEAWQLVWSARFEEARSLARNGLSIKSDVDDELGTARLLLVLAVCDLSERRTRKSNKMIQEAWRRLEDLEYRLEQLELMQDATGVHRTYCTWWSVKAEYLRVRGDVRGEFHALSHAVEKARYIANPLQMPGPFADARVVRTLLALADALRRDNLSEEAIAHLNEADEIMSRRGLPAAVKSPSLVLARPILKRSRFFWWW